jgi:ABC-type antimicrobial peptide transport system permease subunit
MALGASRSSVIVNVMQRGLLFTVIGSCAGLVGVFWLNRLIASLLFGIQPTDSTTATVVIATIVLVSGAACWLPAWRASRLDPNVVLKEY